MEKRVSYFVSRKNVLTWLSTLLLACSVCCRIAYFCEEKGAGNTTVWQMLILPVAACLLYGLVVHLCGKERLYRSAVPFALMCVCFALSGSAYLDMTWLKVILWVTLFVVLIIYNMVFTGRLRHNWLLILILLVILGTQYMVQTSGNPLEWTLAAYADVSMTLGVLCTVLAMQVHLDNAYHPTWGDRPEGRRLRTLDPMTYVANFLMPTRNGANNSIYSSVEIAELEKYIRRKRLEGMSNFGMTHVFMAAYCRCVAQYPGMNRFVSGKRVYSRDREVIVNMTIKREMSVEASDSVIKVKLDVADTAKDIYEKVNAAIMAVKNTPESTGTDKAAAMLNYIPGFLLKFIVWLLECLDSFGLIPQAVLDVSPFHGSVFFTSMGSLGIPPVVHHLYDFGNVPLFCAFGCKRKVNELEDDGTVVKKKYMDFTLNCDERTVDGFYYAAVLKAFRRILQHPDRLDTPPETVVRDVD